MVTFSRPRRSSLGRADETKRLNEYEEAFFVRVDLRPAGVQTAIVSLTCTLDVAATPCPRQAVVDEGSTRTYNFHYPHERGKPRKIGLSGDMLDLASQTPLGSEHTWRIRTKGSQKKFHYEIVVDRSAKRAQLSVDDEKEDIIFPWVSLEDEDCELVSKKADEGPEPNKASGQDGKQRNSQRRAGAREKVIKHGVDRQDVSIVSISSSDVPKKGLLRQRFDGETNHSVSYSARRKMAGKTDDFSSIKNALVEIRKTGESLERLITHEDIQGATSSQIEDIRDAIDGLMKAILTEELYCDSDMENSKQQRVSSIREFAGRSKRLKESADKLTRAMRSSSFRSEFRSETVKSCKDGLYAELSNTATKLMKQVDQLARQIKRLKSASENTTESEGCRGKPTDRLVMA